MIFDAVFGTAYLLLLLFLLFDKNGKKLARIDKNGQELTRMDKKRQELTRIDKN